MKTLWFIRINYFCPMCMYVRLRMPTHMGARTGRITFIEIPKKLITNPSTAATTVDRISPMIIALDFPCLPGGPCFSWGGGGRSCGGGGCPGIINN
jgi:hypothetical protein